MTKSVKEWMLLLNESVDTETPEYWTDEDADKLIADPQVGEYYNFVSNTGVELRGVVTAVDGDDYTLNSDGEIYHVTNADMRDKSEAGEITESDRPRPRATIQQYMVKNDKTLSNEDHSALSAIVHLFAQGHNIDEDPEVFDVEFNKLSAKVHDDVEKLIGYNFNFNESVLTEALNTKQIIAALAITLGLSTTAHAGLLKDLAASIEDTSAAAAATIVKKAQSVADSAESEAKTLAANAKTELSKQYDDKSALAKKNAVDLAGKAKDELSKQYDAQSAALSKAAKAAGMSVAEYTKQQAEVAKDATTAAGKQAAKATGDAISDVADRSKRAAKEFVK